MPELSTHIPDGRAMLQHQWFYPIPIVGIYTLCTYGYFWGIVSILALSSLAAYKQWQAYVLAQDEELVWYANRTMPIYIITEYPGEDIHGTAMYVKQMLDATGNTNKYATAHEFHFQLRPGAARESWTDFEVAATQFMTEIDREAQLHYFAYSNKAYVEFFYNTEKDAILKHNSNMI